MAHILSSMTSALCQEDQKIKEYKALAKPAEVSFLTWTHRFKTGKRIELYNITDLMCALVKESQTQHGALLLTGLHTTTALFINEYQNALLEDMKHFLQELVAEKKTSHHLCDKDRRPNFGYKHNCEHCSNCTRKNASAHIGSVLLGHSLSLPICDGRLALGMWQSIIFAELDGPKVRTLVTQIFGTKYK